MLHNARKKFQEVRRINSQATDIVKKEFKERIFEAKEDRRIIALFCLEFLLVMFIVVSLVFLFDPELAFPAVSALPDYGKWLILIVSILSIFAIYNYLAVLRAEKKEEFLSGFFSNIREIAVFVAQFIVVFLALLLVSSFIFIFHPSIAFSPAALIPDPVKGLMMILAFIIIVKLYGYSAAFRTQRYDGFLFVALSYIKEKITGKH
jgi:hypothetical protein